jgi:hypothetical protein
LERVSELDGFFFVMPPFGKQRTGLAISFIADSAMCCCANALESPFLLKKNINYKKYIQKVQSFYHQLDILHPQGWLYFNDPRNQFAMLGERILTAFRSTVENPSTHRSAGKREGGSASQGSGRL